MVLSHAFLLRLAGLAVLIMVLLGLMCRGMHRNGQGLPVALGDRAMAAAHGELPWYKHAHRTLVHSLALENTTLAERQQLQERSVAKARVLADKTFRRRFKATVPGAAVDGADQVAALRARIDGWTHVATGDDGTDGGGGGRWVHDANATTTRHVQDAYYGQCDKSQVYATNTHVREALRYRWQPGHPLAAESVDAARWCELLGGRNIMVVGDLVQYQIHDLLLDVLRDGTSVCYGELNCKSHTICQDPAPPATLRYVRNDNLASNRRVDMHGGFPSAETVQSPFVAKHMVRGHGVLILNAAAGDNDDDASFMRRLLASMDALRQHKPDALLIYRSSYPGHPHCDDADKPLDRPLTDVEQRRLPYGWSETARRNAIARVIIEAAGGLFVDLGALAELRPDGHIGGQDCLRYCMPGPLDAWATVLYNVMLAAADAVPLNA